MSNRYALQANYTLGHARGDVDNFRLPNSFVPGLTAIDGDRSYQWGPSDTDARHVFVLTGTYDAPLACASAACCLREQDFRLPASPGLTPTATVSSSELRSYGDRPASLSRNSFRYPATITLDASVAYDMRIAGSQRFEIRFDVFNLANRKNIATVNNIVGLESGGSAGDFRHHPHGSRSAAGPDRAALPILGTG